MKISDNVKTLGMGVTASVVAQLVGGRLERADARRELKGGGGSGYGGPFSFSRPQVEPFDRDDLRDLSDKKLRKLARKSMGSLRREILDRQKEDVLYEDITGQWRHLDDHKREVTDGELIAKKFDDAIDKLGHIVGEAKTMEAREVKSRDEQTQYLATLIDKMSENQVKAQERTDNMLSTVLGEMRQSQETVLDKMRQSQETVLDKMNQFQENTAEALTVLIRQQSPEAEDPKPSGKGGKFTIDDVMEAFGDLNNRIELLESEKSLKANPTS